MQRPTISIAGFAVCLTCCRALAAEPAPAPGTHAHYAVLTATPHRAAPFAAVDVIFGPREEVQGVAHFWWQLEVRAEDARSEDDSETEPLFQLRALTREDPLAPRRGELHFRRYLLRIPETAETLEYRSAVSGEALLPNWRDFQRYFIPRRARASNRQRAVPETCTYLGHVLTLRWAGHDVPWKPWDDAKVLALDRELLVGTGRNFKDREGHRLPQKPERRNYGYVPLTADDYRTMIRAGINQFTNPGSHEPLLRAEPVFYLRGAAGTPPLSYPADLYRSNYLGSVMFMDEPAIIMVGDKLIHNSLRYFSDAATLLRSRVRARYLSSGSYGSYRLEASLKERGVNFGEMRLQQHDYPAWETLFETAHYQMEGGLAGIVHEGRYQLGPFDEAVARLTDKPRRHTAGELLRYHFAFLRGGTRPLGKHWGTSIYGQCDPAIAREAVTTAYDMGARYVWFWTSDHGHHLPWPEQLELARLLRDHAKTHPRKSIYGPPPELDRAIAIPDGAMLSLRNLWWVRVMDPQGKNTASQEYHRLMRSALRAYHDALDRGEDFDFVVDTGSKIDGYRNVTRLAEEMEKTR